MSFFSTLVSLSPSSASAPSNHPSTITRFLDLNNAVSSTLITDSYSLPTLQCAPWRCRNPLRWLTCHSLILPTIIFAMLSGLLPLGHRSKMTLALGTAILLLLITRLPSTSLPGLPLAIPLTLILPQCAPLWHIMVGLAASTTSTVISA